MARTPSTSPKRGAAANAKTVSKSEASALLNVSVKTLDDWRNKGCTGIIPGGQCNLAVIQEWEASRREQLVADRFARAGLEVLDKDELEAAILREDLIRKQAENRVTIGQLVRRDEALLEFSRQMTELKNAGNTVGFKWARKLLGQEDEAKVSDLIRAMMDEVFGDLRAIACVDADQRDPDDAEAQIDDDDLDEYGNELEKPEPKPARRPAAKSKAKAK